MTDQLIDRLVELLKCGTLKAVNKSGFWYIRYDTNEDAFLQFSFEADTLVKVIQESYRIYFNK